MDEDRIYQFQFSQMTSKMISGASLTTGNPIRQCQNRKRVKPIRPPKYSKTTGLRTLNTIVDSGAYETDEFHPKASKGRTDAEKDRLAHLMAYGVQPGKLKISNQEIEEKPEIDRFDELVSEIEERKEFLRQMNDLGKRKDYQSQINNEIAERVREMEIIDKQRSKLLEEHINRTKGSK